VDVDEAEDVDATDGRSWPMGLLAEIVTRCQPQQQQQLLPWLLWFLFPFFFFILFFPANKIRKVYAAGCHEAVENEAERGCPQRPACDSLRGATSPFPLLAYLTSGRKRKPK